MSGVVVLGGSGFVGRAVVVALDRVPGQSVRSMGSSDLDLQRRDAAAGLEHVVGDGDALVVAAASRAPGDELVNFVESVAIGRVVAELFSRRHLRQCVYLSSASVYGDERSDMAIHEGTVLAPRSYYAAGKATAENVLAIAAGLTRTPLLTLRLCRVYGPGDTTALYGPIHFLREALSEGRVRLRGDGGELRDHVFGSDVAAVVVEGLRQGLSGTINVASGKSASYRTIVRMIEMISGRPIRVEMGPRTAPRVDQAFDVSLLSRMLPDVVWTDLETGIARTYAELSAAGLHRTA